MLLSAFDLLLNSTYLVSFTPTRPCQHTFAACSSNSGAHNDSDHTSTDSCPYDHATHHDCAAHSGTHDHASDHDCAANGCPHNHASDHHCAANCCPNDRPADHRRPNAHGHSLGRGATRRLY